MRIFSKAEFRGQDPEAVLEIIGRRLEVKVIAGMKKSVEAVKRHLRFMTRAKLVRRSGALFRDVDAAKTDVISDGSRISGTIRIPGMSQNRRGQYVSQYLGTHFGNGVKVIHAKRGMLAIPIKGGPAWKGAAPTAAPKDMKGILMRIGQVLYAGKNARGVNLVPAFVLKPSVTIKQRVRPQDAVDEAQMEILEIFRGMVGEVTQ